MVVGMVVEVVVEVVEDVDEVEVEMQSSTEVQGIPALGQSELHTISPMIGLYSHLHGMVVVEVEVDEVVEVVEDEVVDEVEMVEEVVVVDGQL